MTERNPTDAVVFGRDDLLPKALFEGVTTGLAWGEKLMLSLVRFEPGGDVPEHSHPHEQAGICLEGLFELIVAGRRYTVRPGQMYLVPPDTPHAARAPGEACTTLDIFAPPREEYKS